MKEIRTPLWHRRAAGGSQIFENEGEGALMRLPARHIYDDTRLAFVRVTVYPGDDVDEFVTFLLRCVVRSPDGKVSGRTLWTGWNGVDPSVESNKVAGITRSKIIEHFKDTFNVGKLVRRRLYREVRWLWQEYELSETVGGPSVPDRTPSIQSAVEERVA